MRPDSRQSHATAVLLTLLALTCAETAVAELDLANADVSRLDNGLTVILLEDRNFPVASVQMLYKVGARNEVTGKTGLAHFVEHMAFRKTENFPGTEVVGRIYAVGGEWHGYTWTDQTTYFATVPKQYLDLLLRIEADRMGRLSVDPAAVAAERGSVLAEMHLYENSPTSMLIDTLMFTSFVAHPYRNNTIGFESDIESVTRADVVDFYERHYHPANAVLAVVGDFDGATVLSRIRSLFGGFQRKPGTPPPHTKEPPQWGERRVAISGALPGTQFMIGYRAPAFSNPDFAVFLVLQEILGGGSGVSFLQNDWGTPIRPTGSLHGMDAALSTWLPPSAQDYIFVIGGSAAGQSDRSAIERRIEERVQALRDTPATPARIADAIAAVLDQLVFDVQTTEDAAHQLAFYAGYDALGSFLDLPDRVSSVTPADVRRVATRYLNPQQRSIVWYAPAEVPSAVDSVPAATEERPRVPAGDVDNVAAADAAVTALPGGIPLIVRASDLSSTVAIKVVLPGTDAGDDGLVAADPIDGYSAWNALVRPSQLDAAIRSAADVVARAAAGAAKDEVLSLDPETRMQQEFARSLGRRRPASSSRGAAVIVVAGDVNVEQTTRRLDAAFGDIRPAADVAASPAAIDGGERSVRLGIPVSQARLGYLVAAPGPADPGFEAWRLLLYILSHDYEGRLGKAAISRRGLAYYIDASYHSDGRSAWITLDAGVDPEKAGALKTLLHEELARLVSDPPTAAEVDEARQHLLGRAASRAQSNDELTTELARSWLWFGQIPSIAALESRLADVAVDDVRSAAKEFAKGLTIVVVP